MAGQSTNQFARMLDANKLKGAENFTDWEMDLRIVLDSEKLGYVLEGPLPLAVGEEASEEERRVFETWKDDDLRVTVLWYGRFLYYDDAIETIVREPRTNDCSQSRHGTVPCASG